METESLIAQLARNLRTSPPHGVRQRLLAALSLGTTSATGIMLVAIGLRPDIGPASGTLPFWIKIVFTLSLVGSALGLVERLARPAGRIGRRWWGLVVPVVAAVALAVGELVAAPATDRTGLILGQTAWRCVVAIPLLGLPIILALVWAFRELAPTRLRLAGVACGLLAGSAAAGVYAPACPEASTAFMVTWYTLGIVFTGAMGAAFGQHALRW